MTEEILKFVKEKGYRDKSEILLNFPSEDPEIIDMCLNNMTLKRILNRVQFTKEESGKLNQYNLYYIPV